MSRGTSDRAPRGFLGHHHCTTANVNEQQKPLTRILYVDDDRVVKGRHPQPLSNEAKEQTYMQEPSIQIYDPQLCFCVLFQTLLPSQSNNQIPLLSHSILLTLALHVGFRTVLSIYLWRELSLYSVGVVAWMVVADVFHNEQDYYDQNLNDAVKEPTQPHQLDYRVIIRLGLVEFSRR